MRKKKKDDLTPAQRLALDFIEKRNRAKDGKEVLEDSIKKMKDRLQEKQKQRKEAEKELKRLQDNKKILIALAGIPTDEEDRPNRVKAIDAFFDLLNLVPTKTDDEDKSFNSLYNRVRPITFLFGYVRDASRYDENTKQVVIDGRKLYGLVKARVEEQDRLMKKAQEDFDEMARNGGVLEEEPAEEENVQSDEGNGNAEKPGE